MPQLVGQSCSVCGERIGNTFESAFCEKCANPVHHRCRAPGPAAPAQSCTICSTDLAAASRRAAEQERLRRDEMARRPPPPPLSMAPVFSVYRLRYYIFATVGALGLGIAAFSYGEVVAGLGAVAVGVVLGALTVVTARG